MAETKHNESVDEEFVANHVLPSVAVEESEDTHLIYGLTDSPPIQVTILCGIQQVLISLTSSLVVSSMVAQVVCAADDDVFKARLLSSTLFMNGVTTIAMNVIGVRLSVYQGATAEYILPLLILGASDSMFCSSLKQGDETDTAGLVSNSTVNTTDTDADHMEKVLANVQALQGSLMAAGIFHAMFGFTGLIGKMLRFTGPLTIVPSMVLIAVFAIWVVIDFVKGHWGIGLSTAATGVILSLYLVNYKMPIPVWTPSAGFRITWYPLHQVFSLLIAILINWGICGILTATGTLTNDPNDVGYNTRTDARSRVLAEAPWINIPYPGQYGMVSFSWSAFVCYIIAALTSIIDSVGDYFACARTCEVPPPPKQAVNRGLLVEGMCCFLSGAVGCGHGTTTYGDNIGAIGFTKVASRRVFVCTGLVYVSFGLIGKLSAVFIAIPKPVIGGAAIIMYATFLGVAISNLHSVKLTSSRNMSILGLGIIFGLMIPTYINKIGNPFKTGSETLDMVLVMVVGNVAFCGPVIAFILDNTIPGNIVDRGIAAWIGTDAMMSDLRQKERIEQIYFPLLPRKCLEFRIVKCIPFLPYVNGKEDKHEMVDIKL